LIAGVYDETLMRTLYWQPEVLYRILQQEFRPRRWSVFHTYPFQIGDPLTACYTVDSSHRGVGKIELTEPRSAAGKTVGAELAGWAWDEQGRRPFQDILLTDSQRRIVGIAHTTSDRADLALYFGDPQRLTCGWLGFVRTGVPAGLSAYGVIAGTRRVCPLIAP
jgi:hypothetical protein